MKSKKSALENFPTKFMTPREQFIKKTVEKIFNSKSAVLITLNENDKYEFATFGMPEEDDSLDNTLQDARDPKRHQD